MATFQILGQLFRSHSRNLSSSELLIVVTPVIVDPINSPNEGPPLPKTVVPGLDPNKFDQKFPSAVPGTATPVAQK